MNIDWRTDDDKTFGIAGFGARNMSDLVERLRSWPFESGDPINAETSFALVKEAADEIERLRNERDGYKAGFNLKSAEVAKLCLRVAQLEESNRIYVEDAKRDEQTNADLRSQLVSERERKWCTACGTVTRDDVCDCNRYGEDREPNFVNYADAMQESAAEASREANKFREALEKIAGSGKCSHCNCPKQARAALTDEQGK